MVPIPDNGIKPLLVVALDMDESGDNETKE